MTTPSKPGSPAPGSPAAGAPQRISLGGVAVDLVEREAVPELVAAQLTSTEGPPLLVASANLHHLGEFRPDGPLDGFFEHSTNQWLVLIDGTPLAKRAARLTNRAWPLLAGSDLLPVLLDTAQRTATRVGFLGGATELGPPLQEVCRKRWPDLEFAGHWAPSRQQLRDDAAVRSLTGAIRDARVGLLVVGLGKPQQERWLEACARDAGIRVGLAFGASAEFLTGHQKRAPEVFRRTGAEWLWRLLSDPKRLGRRYVIEGPGEWWRLQRDSHV